MFTTLLIVTFIISVFVSFLIVRVFKKPVTSILNRIVTEEISQPWVKYLTFAIYVVGISGGVRVWDLEKYITPRLEEAEAIMLTTERWTLELYRCIIGTLQSIAWLLLVFFVFALIAYVIVRGRDRKKPQE